MPPRDPVSLLPTHEVTNMPPYRGDVNLYDTDLALKEALHREGGGWAEKEVRAVGVLTGSEHMMELGDLANRYVPELKTFDRYGMRIDEVSFHPAYHELMSRAFAHEIPNFAWNHEGRAGANVAHVAMSYLFNQPEGGAMCPIAMTYSVVAALRHQGEVAKEWVPRLLSREYDPRNIPAVEKTGATMGMFMTEKQGGSDVRTNSTRANAIEAGGPGGEYELSGHKFFCSAPMSDAFLSLAYAENGLSCFLVPRWRPDGTRNSIFIQRLKDKLGNRSNASAEVEYDGTWAVMVGEEGRGVRTIIDMVQRTRLYCALGSAGLMRQALVQALHHTSHRSAFQKKLIQQPLMRNVLADLAIESEAATLLAMRLGRAFDEAPGDAGQAAFARIATAVAKYWVCKRAPAHVYEAMECHGGPGYIEESILPRLYREAPVNSIWEGSGNVICLDVLRAMHKEPETLPAYMAEVELARGGDGYLDKAIDVLKQEISNPADLELRARRIIEHMALVLQGALLVRHAPVAVADAFCASRLGGDTGRAFGTLPATCDFGNIIKRAAG